MRPLLALLFPLLVPGAMAAEPPYAAVNRAVLEGHAIPRLRGLAEAARGLDQAARTACPTGAQALRAAFDRTMDAWMGAQHLRFGPTQLFMRAERLQFWPQGQGRYAEAVDRLDPAGLTDDAVADLSVAAQGLPAVEYLLFGGKVLDARRCAALAAIAGNIARVTAGIAADWAAEGPAGFRARFLNPAPDNPLYQTPRDVSLALFKAFHDQLQLSADIKVAAVLGVSPDKARGNVAESPLAGRSARNIVLNLEALRELYIGADGPGLSALVTAGGGDPKLDPLMRRALDLTLESARAVDDPLSEAVADPARRPAVETLKTRLLALKQIVKTRMAEATGLSIGFNALDGD